MYILLRNIFAVIAVLCGSALIYLEVAGRVRVARIRARANNGQRECRRSKSCYDCRNSEKCLCARIMLDLPHLLETAELYKAESVVGESDVPSALVDDIDVAEAD